MQTVKKKIMVLIDWFDPAFKAGGPIRSCVNFVSHMHDDFELYVLTSCYDLHSSEPLPGIQTGKWTNYKNQAQVFYALPGQLKGTGLQNLINELAPDYVYLNGLFSKQFTLLPLWLKKRQKIRARIVLAPRGMLKESALAYKSLKKKLFLSFTRTMGLQKLVLFQATDLQEKKDVTRHFTNASVIFAPNLPGPVQDQPKALEKESGFLKAVFVGRIHPIKNLAFLIPILKELRGNLQFTIIGAKEDPSYWDECAGQIDRLPTNIKVNYLGEQEHERILDEISQHHLFVLPTRGENFGHAIFESLSLGRPVLISDQTPWKKLSARMAGWDLPLNDASGFKDSFEQAMAWNQQQYNEWSDHALKLAKDFVNESEIKANYLKLFN